ncbi:MAG: bifunctional adenosylcobinamide kinase/adenosylcobinamide-phosphate guanylyltransferase [Deltaproteobacteria bacterium]|nr:bifunctional adenosylcobinamide kinase/adenosylcobinamide-phosphate guanylyltransferase [Deltaproteobacteria bacterium]
MSADPSLPIVLVLGGARSGKSRFALARAAALPPPRVFLATAEALDEEMAARIDRHRAERGGEWRTIEEPFEVAGVLARQTGGVVLIDCLTLWLANRMGAPPGADVGPAVGALLEAVASRHCAVVAVSNEVGLGIVPDNPLARAFRDAAGAMNRAFAEAADEVHLLVAGQALRIR